MSRQSLPRRRVVTDSDDEVGQTTVSSMNGEAVSKLFRCFSQKHHPHTALFVRYVICFLLGGLIGLIPYLVFLTELCKANSDVKNANLAEIHGYSKTRDASKTEAMTSSSGFDRSDTGLTLTTPPVPSTTPRPTRIVKTGRRAEGTGNDDISLQCPGTLRVTGVAAFGIPGDNKTVDDFEKHCQANLAKVDETNVCIVSLKRVYETIYPPFIKTIVAYTCSDSEYIG